MFGIELKKELNGLLPQSKEQIIYSKEPLPFKQQVIKIIVIKLTFKLKLDLVKYMKNDKFCNK